MGLIDYAWRNRSDVFIGPKSGAVKINRGYHPCFTVN
jgi:hypothetical protein